MKNLVATIIIGCLSFVQAPPPPIRLSKEGEICGGFTKTPYKCGKGLECVNTHGPMIVDSPGTSMQSVKQNEMNGGIVSQRIVKYGLTDVIRAHWT